MIVLLIGLLLIEGISRAQVQLFTLPSQLVSDVSDLFSPENTTVVSPTGTPPRAFSAPVLVRLPDPTLSNDVVMNKSYTALRFNQYPSQSEAQRGVESAFVIHGLDLQMGLSVALRMRIVPRLHGQPFSRATYSYNVMELCVFNGTAYERFAALTIEAPSMTGGMRIYDPESRKWKSAIATRTLGVAGQNWKVGDFYDIALSYDPDAGKFAGRAPGLENEDVDFNTAYYSNKSQLLNPNALANMTLIVGAGLDPEATRASILFLNGNSSGDGLSMDISGLVFHTGKPNNATLLTLLDRVRDFRHEPRDLSAASKSESAVAIGVGVGVGIGGLLLLCGVVGTFLVIAARRRRRRNAVYEARDLLDQTGAYPAKYVAQLGTRERLTATGTPSSTASPLNASSAINQKSESRSIPSAHTSSSGENHPSKTILTGFDPAVLGRISKYSSLFYPHLLCEDQKLNQGFFGSVYMTSLCPPDEPPVACAVKVFRFSEKVKYGDFTKELAILHKLNHKNVVSLLGHSVSEDGSMGFILMNLCEGLSLANWLYPSVSLIVPSGRQDVFDAVHPVWNELKGLTNNLITQQGRVACFSLVELEMYPLYAHSAQAQTLLKGTLCGSRIASVSGAWLGANLPVSPSVRVSLSPEGLPVIDVTEPVLILGVGPLLLSFTLTQDLSLTTVFTQLESLLMALPLLGPITRLRIITEVWRACAYLHEGNAAEGRPVVVHGDLKPANILLMADLSVKLGDTGLSKILDRQAGSEKSYVINLPRLGTIGGTQGYIAPELLNDPSSASRPKHGARNDCFSAGVVLMDLFPAWLPLPDDLRQEITALIHQCLAPSFNDRITSQALLLALESLSARYPDAIATSITRSDPGTHLPQSQSPSVLDAQPQTAPAEPAVAAVSRATLHELMSFTLTRPVPFQGPYYGNQTHAQSLPTVTPNSGSGERAAMIGGVPRPSGP